MRGEAAAGSGGLPPLAVDVCVLVTFPPHLLHMYAGLLHQRIEDGISHCLRQCMNRLAVTSDTPKAKTLRPIVFGPQREVSCVYALPPLPTISASSPSVSRPA